MGAEKDELVVAFEGAIRSHADGIDAGPKVLLDAVKSTDAKWADVNIQKAKRVVKAIREAQGAQAESNSKSEKVVAKEKGAEGLCPKNHKLTRFIAYSLGCCDGCGGKVTTGDPMWGCRACDHDLCEAKCHKNQGSKKLLTQFSDVIEGLQLKIDQAVAISPTQEKLEKLLDLIKQETVKHEAQIAKTDDKQLAEEAELRVEEVELRKGQFVKDLTAVHAKILVAIEAGVRRPEAAQTA